MALGRKTGGRKPGTLNKRTIEMRMVDVERQERAIASGASPLEVMLADMRFHHDAALAEVNRGAEADFEKARTSFAAARSAAKDAAPYVHPRLAAIQHSERAGAPDDVTGAREKVARLLGIFDLEDEDMENEELSTPH